MRLSIGEMSKLHNVSIHTLRYYDEIGLLNPSEVDVNSNYRYYDEYDCHRLAKIKTLKEIGLPLKKIQSLLEGTLEEVEESFLLTRRDLIEKVNNLNEILSYLDEQLDYIEELKNGDCYIEPQIVSFPKREGNVINVEDSSSLIERIEAIVHFEKNNNTNAEVFFRPSRLISIQTNGERYLKNYLALKRGVIYGDSKSLYTLEEGRYGVIDHIGHSKNIDKSYEKLYKYIHDKGMKIQKESIEILVVSSNLTDNVMEWRTQIQILVERK